LPVGSQKAISTTSIVVREPYRLVKATIKQVGMTEVGEEALESLSRV
jgi:hypothetical protein